MFVMSVESDGSYITQSVNNAYLDVRGFTKAQIIGKRPDQIRTKKEAASVKSSFTKLIKTGEPISFQEEIQLKRGLLVSETKLTAIYDANGACTYILGVSRDVTKMVNQAKLLDERNTQLDAIFDNAPVEIFLKDSEGYFLKVNKGFSDSLGIEPGEAVGKSTDDIYGNKLAALVRKRDLEVIESKQPQRREDPIWRLDDARPVILFIAVSRV
jgi:PAS domain S-box-containing protein